MSEGSGYAFAPRGLLALGVAGFLVFVVLGFLAARPAEPAEAPPNAAPAPTQGAGDEPPALDEAVALPALAHKRPPAVRRRARWRREQASFDRSQRLARLAAGRAVALAQAEAAPAPAPVVPVAPAVPPPAAAPPAAVPPAQGDPPAGAGPAEPPAGSETPAPFDDGGAPDSGEFDYEDGSSP